MDSKELIRQWFACWQKGNYKDIPLTESFRHRSPYGLIDGKKTYLKLVQANEKQFLGHDFELIDAFYDLNRACVRYIAVKDNFRLEVTEWYYIKDARIDEIVAYYNIEGEIAEDRKLNYSS